MDRKREEEHQNESKEKHDIVVIVVAGYDRDVSAIRDRNGGYADGQPDISATPSKASLTS
jgi:hypothetical protein